MSLIVHYTLKSADDHDHQVNAMQDLADNLKAEQVTGVIYSCFTTDEPTEFVGILEFEHETGFEAFQASAAFATYKAKVGPTFANPPQTQRISSMASSS